MWWNCPQSDSESELLPQAASLSLQQAASVSLQSQCQWLGVATHCHCDCHSHQASLGTRRWHWPGGQVAAMQFKTQFQADFEPSDSNCSVFGRPLKIFETMTTLKGPKRIKTLFSCWTARAARATITTGITQHHSYRQHIWTISFLLSIFWAITLTMKKLFC